MNTNTKNTEENNPVIDDLFEQAARNQGYASLEELAGKSKGKTMTESTEVNEAEGAEFFDKETSDKLFDIAAQNQGFANFQELAESYEKDGKLTK